MPTDRSRGRDGSRANPRDVPRPLTAGERERIVRLQRGFEQTEHEARERIRQAMLARDRAIADAVDADAAVADIARVLGLSRQGVYQAMERARKSS